MTTRVWIVVSVLGMVGCGGEEPGITEDAGPLLEGDSGMEGDSGVDGDAGVEPIEGDGGMPPVVREPDAGPRCVPARETCDRTDEDCDGTIDEGVTTIFFIDADGDGFGTMEATAADCAAPPGFAAAAGDCDDGCAACRPGGTEVCDGVDQDCDSMIDEGVKSFFFRDDDGDGYGYDDVVEACTAPAGWAPRDGDCDDHAASVFPGATELCNARDEDCDAMRDETFACASGSTVGCLTSCGSMGTGRCDVAACTPPSASACTPPAESCNGSDDDCDGIVDERVLRFGTRRDLGAGGMRIDAARTLTGFVVVYGSSRGLLAQRFDATGVPAGAEVMISAGSSDSAIALDGDRLIVTWLGASELRAIVLRTADLSVLTTARTVATVSDFSARVRVAVNGGSTLFAYHDGTAIRGLSRSFPSLTGTTAAVSLAASADMEFDLTSDTDGSRVYLAYATGSDVRLGAFTFSGTLQRTVSLTTDGSTIDHRDPAVTVARLADGSRRIGVAYAHDAAGTTTDRLRFAVVSVALDGSLTLRDTIDASLGTVPSVGMRGPVEVAWSGGRFQATWLAQSGIGTTSTWNVTDVVLPSAGAPTAETSPVEGGAAENRGVTIVPSGAGVFVAATRTDGISRAYVRGCP